jgi:hypothetical protein
VIELCRDAGGKRPDGVATRQERAEDGSDAASAWRMAFLPAPSQRDALIARRMIAETLESAVTWDAWYGALPPCRQNHLFNCPRS